MSDLIDRRAAIGLIHSLYPSAPIMRMNREQWKKKYKPYIEVEKALEQLPSVPEPEIVRCKDCKHFRTYYHGTGSDPVITHACVWFLDRAMGLEDYCSKGVFR